jgi:hypothetical protein
MTGTMVAVSMAARGGAREGQPSHFCEEVVVNS